MVTGIATGSDMTLEQNIDMQLNYFKAEEITDSSVWIFKSHDPIRTFNPVKAKSNKTIVCVRNPFDVIVSVLQFQACY